ncbi:MAG: indolepyruvate oxidoreductase subunit beta [Promethearchaeota archaeon]
MEIKKYNLLNVGVGGQGVIRAVQILSHAALLDGYKVRTAETHGMAQRGGSVASYFRFGSEVEGPLIPRGLTDVIMAFEASEAVRSFNYAGPNTFFFINKDLIIPPMIHQLGMEYPTIEEIQIFLKNVSLNIYFINANELASQAGNLRTMNVVMLGVVSGSGQLPLNNEKLLHAIMKFVPKKAQEVNKVAFNLGIEKGKSLGGK